jgi:long-chain acyl-CoA synthetase
MVPTQFHRMLALPEDVRAKYDCSSTRVMVHAAAPCPVPIKQQMLDWWGDSIHEYYAATEGGGTIVSPLEWRARPGTVGAAWAGSAVVIRDDDGNEVPAGEVGTIWMAMGQAAFEYKDDPAKTAAAQDDDGFFTVGDVGYLDEDGYLFLSDRKIDMIISGGVNIYPAEIENVIGGHPDVADVAVIGVPNDEYGEEVKAIVVANDGVDPEVLGATLRQFCRKQLAGYKLPRSIDFVDDLPRTGTGKVQKRKLRDQYWRDRDRAI